MNFTVSSISIPSRWFDVPERKMNTFQKMGGYKGFNLYLQLYKFRLHNQENEHTFVTSISLLRKETDYSSSEVFDLLKKLKGAKIINIQGVSRWDYLLDEEGNILDDKLLFITLNKDECFPIFTDFQKDEFYIYVSFSLLDKYKKAGLDEKYFALHCLVQRFQRGGTCFMAIEKMSDTLGIDKDTINRMIINLNRNYFMVSFLKTNKLRGEGSHKYEHITFEENYKYEDKNKNVSQWEGWLNLYKSKMDAIAKRADKKVVQKAKQREKTKPSSKRKVKVKVDIPVLEQKVSKNESWGNDDPFNEVDDYYINHGQDEELMNELLANFESDEDRKKREFEKELEDLFG